MDDARLIENLLHTYAEHIDAGDFDGVADLFTHGRIWGAPDPTPDAVFEGREGVRKMYEMTTRRYADDGTPKTHHVTSNAIIEVEGDRAGCRSYYTVLQATPELPLQPIITGRYEDTFHRVDGEWWFDTRIMFVRQVGDLSHHLLFSLGTET